MSHENSGDHKYSVGDYFEVYNDARVNGMVITEVGNIGYDGYRVAEKDAGTDNWRQYWVKAQHLHDEVNIGGLSEPMELDEETFAEIQSRVESEPAEDTNPIPSVKVGEVMPDFVDYDNLPTRPDGSIDLRTMKNDPDAVTLPEGSAIGREETAE
jgi:hypothetical protein